MAASQCDGMASLPWTWSKVVADLFHALVQYGVIRQVDEDFTSIQGQWNHS